MAHTTDTKIDDIFFGLISLKKWFQTNYFGVAAHLESNFDARNHIEFFFVFLIHFFFFVFMLEICKCSATFGATPKSMTRIFSFFPYPYSGLSKEWPPLLVLSTWILYPDLRIPKCSISSESAVFTFATFAKVTSDILRSVLRSHSTTNLFRNNWPFLYLLFYTALTDRLKEEIRLWPR